jgi:hypothetical protein
MEMHPLWMLLDPYIIWFYRLTGYAFADFLFGTFVLAWMALLVGEFTVSVVSLIAGKRIDAATHEARHYQDLSGEALSAGNKEAYRAANKLANDAFGRSFFMQAALSAAFLWPVFVAIAWMDQRFADVSFEFLFTDYSLSHVGVFIVLYAAAYLIFKRIKHSLPHFRRILDVPDTYGRRGREIKTFDQRIPVEPHSRNQ